MFLESKEEYNTKRESKELMIGDSERKKYIRTLKLLPSVMNNLWRHLAGR